MDEEGMKYNYGMNAIYSKKFVEEHLSKFQVVKIPIGMFERATLYFKKYPKEFIKENANQFKPKESLYQMNAKAGINKQEKKATLNLNKPKISVKVFDNPMFKPAVDTQKQYREVTEKIAQEFPDNRTVLCINFDKQYDELFMKKTFGVMGQIRRVFSGAVAKRAEQSASRKLYYHIIVFKHEKDMLRMFDVELFQYTILEQNLPEFRLRNQVEKDNIMRQYVQTVEDHFDETEVMMQDGEGYSYVQTSYPKGKIVDEENQREEIADRKKKKKELLRKDFYKFQMKSMLDKSALAMKRRFDNEEKGRTMAKVAAEQLDVPYEEEEEVEALDEAKLEDGDFLKKRKADLASSFQKQLAALNRKKLMMMK